MFSSLLKSCWRGWSYWIFILGNDTVSSNIQNAILLVDFGVLRCGFHHRYSSKVTLAFPSYVLYNTNSILFVYSSARNKCGITTSAELNQNGYTSITTTISTTTITTTVIVVVLLLYISSSNTNTII